jgi:hypothetical protein
MHVLPRFFYGVRLPDNRAFLHEAEDHSVVRWGDEIRFRFSGPWRDGYAELVGQFGCDSVVTSVKDGAPHQFLEFLAATPKLISLSLFIKAPVDLSPVLGLADLARLRLLWRARQPPPVTDFGRLSRLEECALSLYPAFESVLRLGSIRVLEILDSAARGELNLQGLPGLVELDLSNCPGLTGFRLGTDATLVALEAAGCRKLRVDWDRVGHDLRYLSYQGKNGFGLTEIEHAPHLRSLMLTDVPRGTSLAVLERLRNLEAVHAVSLGLTKGDRDLIKGINSAHGHGETVTADPPRYAAG